MNAPQRVLVVEDNDIDLKLAVRVLGKVWPDTEVLGASDGAEAIALLESSAGALPDIILLDINMPRMNGHEFLEAWYADRGLEIPVVLMLTSSDSPADLERVYRYSCVKSYILKPITRATAAQLPDLAAGAEGDGRA